MSADETSVVGQRKSFSITPATPGAVYSSVQKGRATIIYIIKKPTF